MSDAARPGSTRRIWVAVPFRGPVGSKRRLAGLLDASERERLSLAMLADVLDVLLATERVERVVLLTRSVDGLDVPENERLRVVQEPPAGTDSSEERGLNGALRHAQRIAADGGAESLVILPADLPMIAGDDLDALLDISDGIGMAIVPDRAADGTNALVLTPPTALAPSFGAASYARHIQQAFTTRLSVAVLERARLALDLDTPADVAALLAHEHNGRAAALLRDLRIDRRLERFAPAQARSTTI